MWHKNIRIDYFFQEFRRFPWELVGLTVPKVGPLHVYLCIATAPYVHPDHRTFFRGNPSLFELKRFAEENGGMASRIVNYTENNASVKMDKAKAVLGFLREVKEFRDTFQKKIDSLYHQDLISIPDAARPIGD